MIQYEPNIFSVGRYIVCRPAGRECLKAVAFAFMSTFVAPVRKNKKTQRLGLVGGQSYVWMLCSVMFRTTTMIVLRIVVEVSGEQASFCTQEQPAATQILTPCGDP